MYLSEGGKAQGTGGWRGPGLAVVRQGVREEGTAGWSAGTTENRIRHTVIQNSNATLIHLGRDV